MSRWLFSSMLTALTSTALAAQSVQTPNPAGSAQQSVTLSGCVNPGTTAAAPFTLSNATRFGPTTVPEPSTVSPPPSTSPTGAPSVTTGTTGAAGATGTTGATGTAGAAGGTAGTTSTTGVAGTTGATTPATAAVTGLPPSTYQLSGTSVSSYVGQSVQVTGMLVPSPNVAATTGTGSSGVTRPTGGTDVVGATPPMLPEFRVVRVEPLGIRCPQ
jgi:hypothetical protein